MAAAIMKKTCAKCNKDGGTAMCYGCEQAFCTKHFIEHRQELSQQMDNIGQEHDVLQRDLIDKQSTHSLLSRIDQWEQESITKIQVAAEAARADLQKSLDRMKDDLKKSISKITEELRSSRESDDYTELDIKKWTDQLEELRTMLDNPSTISMKYDNGTQSAIRLIRLDGAQASPSSSLVSRLYKNDNRSQTMITSAGEKFDAFLGDVVLSKDGLIAKSLTDLGSCISGIGRYSSGVHHIRFQIEHISYPFSLFFGVVASLQELTADIWNNASVHGRTGFGRPFVLGVLYEQYSTEISRTEDKVTLTLDCDNRQIQLERHRTNKLEKLPVNVDHCPFPWKIVIALPFENDCVRILH